MIRNSRKLIDRENIILIDDARNKIIERGYVIRGATSQPRVLADNYQFEFTYESGCVLTTYMT